ncbi:amidohydrolase family protein [Stagnimonas aquatica]|uniref:Amidohydrolase family protein n=1 Tax=Stagnimonas aquatica TaxID=2689987 RepID=A0A3N0V7Q6_9GAMM|nr:amidohydrolase family protein [Stagnimonas aquatica]ROH88840.1 amidohydrolase family protein [Stagnimonas aquatica]
MAAVLFHNARLFDGWNAECRENVSLQVEGGQIRAIVEGELRVEGAERIDCRGRTLMPGLIDAHVHVYASSFDLARDAQRGSSYSAHYAARFLRHALDCGFTTVRDVGGGDRGLALALAEGLLPGPRLYYGGRVLSQTGGHGDFRSPDLDAHGAACGCAAPLSFGMAIADGPEAVRLAVREELRRGASHIKLMASGGVTSPSDPIERCQCSEEEVRMAVREAGRAGAYVAAHCHADAAVRHCLDWGVRSIEHASLIEADTAALLAARGAYAVPTLAIVEALRSNGGALGLPPASLAKLERVAQGALSSLERLQAAGARIGFGTDLLGPLYRRRGQEFLLRRQVQPALEILRSACAVNAALLQQEGRLGRLVVGAAADLLLVEGDPLADLGLLAGEGEALAAIMKAGQFHKRPQA